MRRRLDVDEPALGDGVLLAVERERRGAPVDEVELVLLVVVVIRPFVARREDESVDAERSDAERLADLAKAVALAELIERRNRVAHALILRLAARSGPVTPSRLCTRSSCV